MTALWFALGFVAGVLAWPVSFYVALLRNFWRNRRGDRP